MKGHDVFRDPSKPEGAILASFVTRRRANFFRLDKTASMADTLVERSFGRKRNDQEIEIISGRMFDD